MDRMKSDIVRSLAYLIYGVVVCYFYWSSSNNCRANDLWIWIGSLIVVISTFTNLVKTVVLSGDFIRVWINRRMKKRNEGKSLLGPEGRRTTDLE